VVPNHALSTDLDEDEEIAESADLDRGSRPHRQSEYSDECEDEIENERDDQSSVMEDSLNEVSSLNLFPFSLLRFSDWRRFY
jgi:hypothetical protein